MIFKGTREVFYLNGIYCTLKYNVRTHSCCIFFLQRQLLFLGSLSLFLSHILSFQLTMKTGEKSGAASPDSFPGVKLIPSSYKE